MMATEENFDYGAVSEPESMVFKDDDRSPEAVKSEMQQDAPAPDETVAEQSPAPAVELIASGEAVSRPEMKREAKSVPAPESDFNSYIAEAEMSEAFGMEMFIEEDLIMDQDESVIFTDDESSGEEYRAISENSFIVTAVKPLSTFAIDVDTASYANVRRFINNGMLPNPDAVRLEELVNYFSYDYPQPEAGLPFSFITELSECPWDADHLLLHIGLQGYEVPARDLPPTNIVFLIDSSGSMQDENKLPLLKDSM